MFFRSGAKAIRSLYDEARKNTPCVVFLDELDSIGPMRLIDSMSGGAYTSRDTVDQLLAALDGFNSNDGVLTIGATNFPQRLDSALTRPGRFDSKVTVGFPDKKGSHFAVFLQKCSEFFYSVAVFLHKDSKRDLSIYFEIF